MNKLKLETVLKTPEGLNVYLRNAKPEDMRRIQVLYGDVYGPNYPMPVIFDKFKMRRAIESDRYCWLVAECQGRIVASLIYEVDPSQRISKAFGAVVSKEFRKQNLANTMMETILRELTKNRIVDTVYATTRTVTTAPQQLTETLGFVKLGIFPNVHKVFEYETHCLAAYFVPEALKNRRTPPALIHEMAPFYRLVHDKVNIGKAVFRPPSPALREKTKNPAKEQSLLSFETISAPSFIKNRFAKARNSGVFANNYVPFHDPNLMLITPDQSTEVFLNYGATDRYSVIMGGKSEIKDFSLILNSVAKTLNNMGVSYIELLVDAYSPDLQWQALHARFLPSAYFPAFRKVGDKRWDYIVFSRSFEMLDFRNVKIMSTYRNFLKEYMKIWQALYIDLAFKDSLER